MLRLIYRRRFTSFGVILLRGKNNAAVALAPFLLILLKSGAHGRRDLLAILWVFLKMLPHFQSIHKKNSAHLRGVAFTDPHIAYPEMKNNKKDTTTSQRKNIINISCCMRRGR